MKIDGSQAGRSAGHDEFVYFTARVLLSLARVGSSEI